ncbi:defensin beta 118 [Meriones unguiculatus]|uniref:defensin beta 118 n=1 Tax=Meriones unguiculatus TaxID=10047 RepID=UPI000B4F5708|nr:defensin beta 118 [Meriones unguiculatus]
MRLLLLALPVLALLPQVIPAYGGEKKCLSKSGHCRKKCNYGEMIQEACKNHRVCCVPDTRHRKQKAFIASTTEPTSTTEYDLPSDFMDVLSMMPDSGNLAGIDDGVTKTPGRWLGSSVPRIYDSS